MAIKKHIKKGSGIRQQQWCCPPEGVHDCMSYNYGNPVTGFLAHEYFQIFYISNQWTPHPPYGGFFGSVTDTKFAEFGVDKPANYQMGYLQYQSESSGWGDGWYGNLQNVVNGGIYKMSINSNVLSQMNFKLYFIHPCVGRIEIPNNFNSSESNVVYFQLSNNPSFLPQLAPSDEVIPINKPGGGTPPDAIGPGIGHMDIPLPDFGEMETDPSGPGLGPPPPIPQRPPSIAGPISPGTSEIVPDIQVKPSPGSIDHLGFTDEPLYPNQCNCGNFPGVFSCGEFVPTSVWNPDIHYGSTLNPDTDTPVPFQNFCAPGAVLPKWFTDCMLGSQVILESGNNPYYQDAGVCWLPNNAPSPNAGGGWDCLELLWSSFTPQWTGQPLAGDAYQYEWILYSDPAYTHLSQAMIAIGLGWRLCEWPDSCNCQYYENSYWYPGCTAGSSPNFNPLANYEDGTCVSYGEQVGPEGLSYIPGCTDPMFDSYDESATVQSQPPFNSCNPPIGHWYRWEAIVETGQTYQFTTNTNPPTTYTLPYYGDVNPPSCDVLCSTGGSDGYGNSWQGLGLTCYGDYYSGHCPRLREEFNLNDEVQHYSTARNMRGGSVIWEQRDYPGDDPDGFASSPWSPSDDSWLRKSCNYNPPARGGSGPGDASRPGYPEIYCCCA